MTVTKLNKGNLISTVTKKLLETEILLDIGCGIIPQNFTQPLVHICCEPFLEYVKVLSEKTKDLKDRKYIIINSSWEEVLKIFPEKSVDCVYLIDVIEHLVKEDALRLLKETEKICKQQIVIFTPLGFLPQNHPDGIDAWGLHGGHMQEHKSGWVPDDFNDNWDIYYSEVFHEYNNLGNKFETPYGALFAIKNFDDNLAYNEKETHNIHYLIDKLNHKFILVPIVCLLRILLFVKSQARGVKRLFYR
jgi:hypothetical protein